MSEEAQKQITDYTPNEIGQIEQGESIEKQIEKNLKILTGWIKNCFNESSDDSMDTNSHENIASKVKETLEFLEKFSTIIPPLNKRKMHINSKSNFIFQRMCKLIDIFNYRPHLNLLLPKTQESKNIVRLNLDSKISSDQYVKKYGRNIDFCNDQKQLILQEIFTKKHI
jgi:hypothetical protein